ncbi:hypothetical protein, partial [Phenylobacterium sp.]|uniref:hypothetical protein n=1 Tax=Phenylobacterium sp. TaxID=1871053 RepID=UPI002F42AAE8
AYPGDISFAPARISLGITQGQARDATATLRSCLRARAASASSACVMAVYEPGVQEAVTRLPANERLALVHTLRSWAHSAAIVRVGRAQQPLLTASAR